MTAKKPRAHWVYYFGRCLTRFLVFFFAFWKTRGKENVPQEGSFLIVSNHIFIADPPMLASSIPRRCYFMAKEDLWHNRWSRYWVENFGAFPVKRDTFDRDAIRRAEEKLEQGFGVIMFPEGGRSQNAQLKTALPGAALIAARMNVPILPVAITGSEKLKNLWWSFWHHPTVTVPIGQPFSLPPADESKPTREQRREMIDYIMGKIAELLPPENQGVYAAEKTGNH